MDHDSSDSSDEKVQYEDSQEEKRHLFGRQNPVHTALGGGKRMYMSLSLYDYLCDWMCYVCNTKEIEYILCVSCVCFCGQKRKGFEDFSVLVQV